jgi:hypothetical protein
VTSARRYLVVADYQRRTANIAVGTKAFVLFIAEPSGVVVVVRDRSGQVRLRPETLDKLASFRIKPVVEATCPRAAWRWAQATPDRCEELLSRCKQMRLRLRSRSRS